METRARAAKRLKEEAPRDRISNLPDAILNHILSFFSLEFIAQLGTLSKRWSYIWRCYPNLDFSNIIPRQPPPTTENPKLDKEDWKFVLDVLWQRKLHSNIKVFRFIGEVTPQWLNRCMLHVMVHGVEELDLQLKMKFLPDNFELPLRLFTCGTLKNVKLSFGSPSILQFRVKAYELRSGSVTSLSLENVEFTRKRGSPKNKNHMFSSRNFPCLRALHLKQCHGFRDLDVNCSSLEDLSLIALRLRSSAIFGTKLVTIFLSDIIVLDSVKISAPNVRHLSISQKIDKVILVSTYINLKHFKITTPLKKEDILGITSLLKTTRFLQSITMLVKHWPWNESNMWNRFLLDNANTSEEEYWESQVHVLKPFLCSIKTVEIECDGSVQQNAVDLVKFLLKHGLGLEEMILSCQNILPEYQSWREKVGSQLVGLPKASCKVKVSIV